MAAITEIHTRPFDELLDSVRMDLSSFQSVGDIDASTLIKIAQMINYELGLRIYSMKETMLEVNHFRTKLPADFHQSLLTLICHQWRHVQNAPWNGHVLLEQIEPTVVAPPSDCPCWTVRSQNAQVPVTYCDGTQETVFFPANTDGSPKTTKLCATLVDIANAHGGAISGTTSTFCYPGVNGVYDCDPVNTCGICEINHVGDCPELVMNPYPLGSHRTICNDTINIKIIGYCQSEVRCYEQFERLYIEPYIQADAFSRQNQFRNQHNRGTISGGYLETPGMERGKVYIYYLGGMEDNDGNLLVLDHPKINMYYEYRLKKQILEMLYVNGEDMIQRLQYIDGQLKEYREQALSIANMPNYREVIKTIAINRDSFKRNYYHTISRYYGRLGWAIPVDNFSQY